MVGIILTIVTGLFFWLGIVLSKKCKNKKNVSIFAIGLAFIILLNLLIFDIGAEVLENFSLISILYVLLGLILLKVMDLFVPHHEHHHNEKNDNVKEHKGHMQHIGIITVLALILHNIIECMALFNVTTNSTKAGILMCLAIGLHNIPLGFQVGSFTNKKVSICDVALITSGFFGGIISMLIGSFNIQITNFILCFTLGMLIYLTFFEFLKELWENRNNKNGLYGIIIGIFIIIISKLL